MMRSRITELAHQGRSCVAGTRPKDRSSLVLLQRMRNPAGRAGERKQHKRCIRGQTRALSERSQRKVDIGITPTPCATIRCSVCGVLDMGAQIQQEHRISVAESRRQPPGARQARGSLARGAGNKLLPLTISRGGGPWAGRCRSPQAWARADQSLHPSPQRHRSWRHNRSPRWRGGACPCGACAVCG